MNTVIRISVIASTTYFVAACSTQQVAQESPVAQNTPQSQVTTTNTATTKPVVLPMPANTTVVKKPAPRVVQAAVQPKKVVVQKKVVPKPAVRVIPAAPKVNTVKKPAPATNQSPWARRQLAMNRMASWTMAGRSALRFKSEGWTFGLNWVQRNRQQYALQIRNPLTGAVVGILDQSPGRATLRARGKIHNGTDAERLLQQQLGVKMPVNGMPYWIRGVMASQYPAGKVTLDAKGRPKQIIQAGWVIDYFNYQNLRFDALPSKINISRVQEQVNVRILAKQWKTP